MDSNTSGSKSNNTGTGSSSVNAASLDAAPKLMVVLSQIQPALKKVYRLHKDQIVIGSMVSTDVQIQGDGISPIHGVIEIHESGKATIYDLASLTGIFVNGVKGVTMPLKTGDEITLGRITLKFSVEDPATWSTGKRVKETDDGRKLILPDDEDLKPLLLEEGKNFEEIFDHRPTNRGALEVAMSWSDSILNVEHFVDREQIHIGSDPGNDFTIPPLLPSGHYPLVNRHQDGLYAVTLDPKMKGVVQRQGQIFQLDQMRAMLGNSPLILARNEFAKISVADIDFFLSYTAAPPQLKTRKLFENDPYFLRILGTSLAFFGMMIGIVMKLDPPKPLEVEQLPERLATIIYEAEQFKPKPKPEPKPKSVAEIEKVEPKKPEPEKVVKVNLDDKKEIPKDVPKTMQMVADQKKSGAKSRKEDEAKEGAGARAKGKEGARGNPNAAKGKDPQDLAKRTSPQGGEGRGGGNSEVQDQGNVDLLKGAASTVQNILGNTAAKLGQGGSELKGFGNFSTLGKGGAALSGDGKGGGGDAEGLGGLADKGRGGGRVGTGMGAAGNGSGIIGGRSRVALRSGSGEEAVVMGSIDKGAIEAALLAHKDEFRLCYEREINAENPNISGRVRTSFTIGASGRVTESGVVESTIRNANVERCVLTVLRRIQFPVPAGASTVQVTKLFIYEKTK
jgi:outer membrane biosynthesis protein TonB